MPLDQTILEGVGGWLWPDEAAALYDAARHGPAARVAEIGCHKGRSTIALAMGLEHRGEGTVLAIDPYDGEIEGESGEARRAAWEANLARAGLRHRVALLASSSHDAVSGVEMRSLGALFVDGSHDYEDVLLDLDDWIPRLVPGAFVLLNDPVLPGVAKALRDRVGKRKSPLRHPALLTNTVWTQYLPDGPWTFGDELRRLRLVVALVLAPRLVRHVERWGSGDILSRVLAKAAYGTGRAVLAILLPAPKTPH